ncbi:ComEA family DNA-binding protein [Nesterenkonia flava]
MHPRTPTDADEEEQQLGRRERMRTARRERYASPTRFRVGAAAVVLPVITVLAWLVVSWVTGAHNPLSSSSSQDLPEAPTLHGVPAETAQPAETHHRLVEEREPGQEHGPVLVHVAGAVKDPQVVELETGARVYEAIDSAGGLRLDAAQEGVNLAAEVTDGSLIWVPTRDELDEGFVPPGGGGDVTAPASPTEGESSLININTADAAELEQLPGIGPALSQRIVTYREDHGPFQALEELAAVSGIGPAILENVADMVTW